MSAQYTSGLVPKIHRIALVDNDPRALESLSYLIEDKVPTAYVVWTATSGNEAIERCQETGNNLSLLILDMSMEGLQGPATCRRIRLVDRHLPILGVTSFSIRSYRDKLMEAGAQGLISKEDSNQLAQAIERLCGGSVMEGFESPALANLRISRETRPRRSSPCARSKSSPCARTVCWIGRSPSNWTFLKALSVSICKASSKSSTARRPVRRWRCG